MILPMVLVIGVMYFLMIRPQKKKDKELAQMRNSLEVGDIITTIGGIVGPVVSVKEDTVVIETGSERTKIRFKRWAIQSVEKLTVE
ncbi:MAG: preprotein translocase subunit YajC [Oscillospiraceae bacterium]|nr:preprotein translocase subunit YajC [Oscillospiraceae bacterium]